jgi:gamma-glutamylcyclotransferase (GGCT)/AIG2-like uncharacterized protein YtfP
MHALLAGSADYVDEATYRGRLYRVATYPGVIPSSDPAHVVYGEVYRLHEPSVLERLDQYEECGPAFPPPAQYVRERQQVALRNGESLLAWVYLYNLPVDPRTWIRSGDFLRDTE